MGYGIIFMILPPYNLIGFAVLLVLSLITVFGINRLKGIVLPENMRKNPVLRTAFKLAFSSWIAVIVSMIIMLVWSGIDPYFANVNSEWGVRYTQLFWNPGTVYLMLWTLLAVAITVWLYLRKESAIIDKRMNRFILTIYLIEFAILWLLANGYIYLILLRDRTMM